MKNQKVKIFTLMALVFFAFALPLLVVRKFFGKVIQCMEDQKMSHFRRGICNFISLH